MFRYLPAAVALLSIPALADDFRAGNLLVTYPYSLETPSSAPTAAGYFSVTNEGQQPDHLDAVLHANGNAQLFHATHFRGQTIWEPIDRVEIAPGETVKFNPKEYQVVFSGLAGITWAAGDSAPAVLVFEKAGKVPVTFQIETLREEDGGGHTAH
ncbi:MAG TPA: copper chaperone PCu(A)C [Paracoccus sp. (in: a-proteobacteria)]|uniref:copper chaperone PCu(A)C n=1 Tax=Paracoccus sp. TaxID=267 RepID=UPI002C20DAC7|nr:copper chaperone PCu(A)C [Paracoccus sp. (in: a-proteobacteria)]HWL59252.1 copper chaperone PCu(A)C [Paracoccus sp. (in: a-proteobacteria)]